jgi:FAD/FMN-containing dehydrogenase
MPYTLSAKKTRDATLIAQWSAAQPASLADLKTLQTALRGHIVLPTDPTYDSARKLFNPLFDPHPAMIVYCDVEQDIALALAYARDHHMPVRVRAGGHSTAGFSAGPGMVIDVSLMDDVCVDAAKATASVGPGCTFGKLNSVLDMYGLHVPGGDCAGVCVAGFMQGGGYSFTSRAFGMNCDNVLQVRMMLADGRIVTANRTQNHDLWWAVRGGTGGNFGILLNIVYRLHRLGDIFGFSITWPLTEPPDRDRAAQALMLVQENYLRSGAPPQMALRPMIGYQSTKPDRSDPLPYLLIRGVFVGSADQGSAGIAPLLALDGATLQYTKVGRYSELDSYLMSVPRNLPELDPKRGMTDELKDSRYVERDLRPEDWRSLLDFFISTPNRWSFLLMEVYGGAINAFPREDSAFIHRSAAFSLYLDVFYYPDDNKDACSRYLQDFRSLMAPWWNGRIYQNYPTEDAPDFRRNYWGEAFPALLAVKQKYDPDNFFTFPQAIAPDPAAPPPAPTWPDKVVEATRHPIVY